MLAMCETKIFYVDRKYRDDTVFQMINRQLTLNEKKTKSQTIHLNRVIKVFINLMEQESDLFEDTFQRIMYGGSFYKKTKFGEPDEFDLDFVFKLPVNYSNITIVTNHTNYGYVKIKIDETWHQHPLWSKHSRRFLTWLDENNHLKQNMFRNWFEGVFIRAFNILSIILNKEYELDYIIEQKKSGPAFTLLMTTPEGFKIAVDLVPCFEFNNVLGNGYISITSDKKSWLAIPKPFYSPDCSDYLLYTEQNTLWRLSFYEQEKEFLEGNFKDVIRMLKKFRDTRRWKSIASYYIETIFYNEIYNHKENGTWYNFLHASKTGLFMHGLSKLFEALDAYCIPYFWNPHHNLLSRIKQTELQGYRNNLRKIILKIDREIMIDSFILAKSVLEDYEGLDEVPHVQGESYNFSEPECVQYVPAQSTIQENNYCQIL